MSQGFDDSSIQVQEPEGHSWAEDIPVAGESVTAFLGPAPRGPVDRALSIGCLADFEKHFGVPDFHCRMEFAIRQFFANGGRNAVVARVAGTTERNRIHLHTADGELLLAARNPGPLEFIRASVDYDGIAEGEEACFNLVIQRLRSEDSVWIDEQEYFRGVTVDPTSRDYVGKVLTQSTLVGLAGRPPAQRPEQTIKPGTIREAGYVSALAERISNPPPTDYDLVGAAARGTGLSALARVRDIAHLCVISGSADAAIGPVMMLAAERFCRAHQAMLIVDPPARWRTVDDVIADQHRSDFASPNAMTWFPQVRLRSSSGERVLTSATGSIAAALVELDRTRGVPRLHDNALTMQRGGLRLDLELGAEDRLRLARVGVNSVIRRSAAHNQLVGNVTQARHVNMIGGCDELDLRIDILFILRRLRQGTRWVAFHESTPRVWRELQNQVGEFLAGLHERSMLAGLTPRQASFCKCDHETNRGIAMPGAVVFVVGVALRKPGEYLTFRFQQSAAGCRIAELGWQSELALTG